MAWTFVDVVGDSAVVLRRRTERPESSGGPHNVDASAFQFITSSNTKALVFMLAERKSYGSVGWLKRAWL
jgi:hypothetical protein